MTATRALALGLALGAGLWIGIIPLVTRLSAQHASLLHRFNPRVADVFALALNVALLVALLIVDRLHRRSRRAGGRRWE